SSSRLVAAGSSAAGMTPIEDADWDGLIGWGFSATARRGVSAAPSLPPVTLASSSLASPEAKTTAPLVAITAARPKQAANTARLGSLRRRRDEVNGLGAKGIGDGVDEALR